MEAAKRRKTSTTYVPDRNKAVGVGRRLTLKRRQTTVRPITFESSANESSPSPVLQKDVSTLKNKKSQLRQQEQVLVTGHQKQRAEDLDSVLSFSPDADTDLSLPEPHDFADYCRSRESNPVTRGVKSHPLTTNKVDEATISSSVGASKQLQRSELLLVDAESISSPIRSPNSDHAPKKLQTESNKDNESANLSLESPQTRCTPKALNGEMIESDEQPKSSQVYGSPKILCSQVSEVSLNAETLIKNPEHHGTPKALNCEIVEGGQQPHSSKDLGTLVAGWISLRSSKHPGTPKSLHNKTVENSASKAVEKSRSPSPSVSALVGDGNVVQSSHKNSEESVTTSILSSTRPGAEFDNEDQGRQGDSDEQQQHTLKADTITQSESGHSQLEMINHRKEIQHFDHNSNERNLEGGQQTEFAERPVSENANLPSVSDATKENSVPSTAGGRMVQSKYDLREIESPKPPQQAPAMTASCPSEFIADGGECATVAQPDSTVDVDVEPSDDIEDQPTTSGMKSNASKGLMTGLHEKAVASDELITNKHVRSNARLAFFTPSKDGHLQKNKQSNIQSRLAVDSECTFKAPLPVADSFFSKLDVSTTTPDTSPTSSPTISTTAAAEAITEMSFELEPDTAGKPNHLHQVDQGGRKQVVNRVQRSQPAGKNTDPADVVLIHVVPDLPSSDEEEYVRPNLSNLTEMDVIMSTVDKVIDDFISNDMKNADPEVKAFISRVTEGAQSKLRRLNRSSRKVKSLNKQLGVSTRLLVKRRKELLQEQQLHSRLQMEIGRLEVKTKSKPRGASAAPAKVTDPDIKAFLSELNRFRMP